MCTHCMFCSCPHHFIGRGAEIECWQAGWRDWISIQGERTGITSGPQTEREEEQEEGWNIDSVEWIIALTHANTHAHIYAHCHPIYPSPQHVAPCSTQCYTAADPLLKTLHHSHSYNAFNSHRTAVMSTFISISYCWSITSIWLHNRNVIEYINKPFINTPFMHAWKFQIKLKECPVVVFAL